MFTAVLFFFFLLMNNVHSIFFPKDQEMHILCEYFFLQLNLFNTMDLAKSKMAGSTLFMGKILP